MKGGKYAILQIISHTFHLRALLAVLILKFGVSETGLGAFAEDGDDLFADRARVVLLDDGDILILAAKVLIPLSQPFVKLGEKAPVDLFLRRHPQPPCNALRFLLHLLLIGMGGRRLELFLPFVHLFAEGNIQPAHFFELFCKL